MNRTVRRRLEMAVRVRDFSRAHPSADANYAPVLARLEDRITHMEGLAEQQQSGFQARRSSAARRRGLRRRIHNGLLRHLVTVADDAAAEEPTLMERLELPAGNAPNEAFRTLARQILKQGQAQREVLVKHGLAERLLDDLAAAVDQFDAAMVETNEGRRAHVGARAELKTASDEVMHLVELLDGLNQYRFGDDSELMAAWLSARRVMTGPRSEEKEAPPEVPPGEVKPAA
jgi:hypothetical protein